MTTNEFSRLVRLDTLGAGARPMTIAADADERERLAQRFGLVAIDRLEADVGLTRDAGTVRAEGRFTAAVVQSCVATGEPLPATVSQPFTLRFIPGEETDAPSDEIGLSETDCDTLFYEGAAIDLGEAVAQTMLLALDPFPRHPDADARLRAAGVLTEEDAGPFAALKALRDRLSQ